MSKKGELKLMKPNLLPYNVTFSGTGREYFGIWIVNLILTIITLGIYSAWAKVKRETYFKNNTRVFDAGFGYHATGGQIFKGRLIAFIVLFLVNVLSTVKPLFGVVAVPIFVVFIPWILNSSLRFSARMTSFRNIRFNWHGTYWKTMWFLVIAPLVGVLTFGLLTPLISKYYYSYFASSHTYGTTRFSSTPKIRQFYFAFLISTIVPTIVLGCVAFTLLTVTAKFSNVGLFGSSAIWAVIPLIYAFMFSVVSIYTVLCRNLMMKSLTLGSTLTFDSQINPFKLIWISLSNLFLTLLSLGLLLPWAKVRMYNYLSAMTFVTAIGDINEFIDEINSTQSSLGEAISDFEGVEVAI
jgi:uncharacterized membrane protein YjgN (DUF898 family)